MRAEGLFLTRPPPLTARVRETERGTKKLTAAAAPNPTPQNTRRAGTRPEKIRIQKWYTIYKDHITLADYEIHGEC